MEFIRQLVAFSILMEFNEGIIGKSPEHVQDVWVGIVNMTSEDQIIELLGPSLTKNYLAWLQKWNKGEPVAQAELTWFFESTLTEELPQEKPEPEVSPVTEEPKPKKRRAKRVKSHKG